MLFLKSLDNTLPSRYRYEIQISYWDTEIQIWDTDQLLRYRDTVIQIWDTYKLLRYKDTVIHRWDTYQLLRYRDTVIQQWDTDSWDIDEIHAFGAVWVHIEALGRVLGRFCPLGIRLCMHRYDEIWDNISLSIRVAPGRDVTQIVRHCPPVEVRMW